MGSLIAVVGPIASGKSTVARLLGERLRRDGREVAVVDLDDVVEARGGFAGLSPEDFGRAQEVHGELVGSWLRRGVDVVAHGPFIQPHERDALLGAVPPTVQIRWLLLTVPFDVAQGRVEADPGRQLAQFPEVLRQAHERFDALAPGLPPSDWAFDTSTTSAEEIVGAVCSSVAGSSAG